MLSVTSCFRATWLKKGCSHRQSESLFVLFLCRWQHVKYIKHHSYCWHASSLGDKPRRVQTRKALQGASRNVPLLSWKLVTGPPSQGHSAWMLSTPFRDEHRRRRLGFLTTSLTLCNRAVILTPIASALFTARDKSHRIMEWWSFGRASFTTLLL